MYENIEASLERFWRFPLSGCSRLPPHPSHPVRTGNCTFKFILCVTYYLDIYLMDFYFVRKDCGCGNDASTCTWGQWINLVSWAAVWKLDELWCYSEMFREHTARPWCPQLAVHSSIWEWSGLNTGWSVDWNISDLSPNSFWEARRARAMTSCRWNAINLLSLI